jgi:UDP-glucose:(heptosyl)LPS alpha-1,3-glucosyltransferase
MRIALVVERFQPGGGGVEQVAWQLAHGLGRAGHDVHVLAREGCPPLAAAQTADPGARTPVLHRLPVRVRWQPLRVRLFDRRARRFLDAGLEHFDVVHSLTRTRHQDLYRAGGGSHADYLLRTHGPVGARWRRLSPRHRVLLRAEARLFADPDQAIQCGSERVAGELRQRFPAAADRLFVLHNGVDCPRFAPGRWTDDAQRIRDQHASPGETVWLFAGSGGRRKGLDTAIRALARCRDERAVLFVAGRDAPAPFRRLAEAEGVGARVRFLGERADMPALYAAADALLLPTRYDAFANVCLESAASGRPVVTSAANGAAELLGDCGQIVADPEDVAGFAAAMEALAAPEARRALGEAALELARAHDWPEHVRQLEAHYRAIVRQRGRRPDVLLDWQQADPPSRERAERWLRAEPDLGDAPRILGQSEHRLVLHLPGEGDAPALVAKLFRRASGPHPHREALKQRLAADAATREHGALCALHAAGAPVPAPLGLARGPSGDALLLMSAIEGVSLRAWLTREPGPSAGTDERRTRFESLGLAVRTLHGAGFAHGDLHPGNVLVTPDGAIRLIDLQRARPASSASRHAQRDLALLDDSLSRLGASHGERLALLRAALAIDPGEPDSAPALRAALRASQRAGRAHLRARRRHCLRPGARFEAIAVGGRAGLALRGAPTPVLQQMTGAGERIETAEGCYRVERLEPRGFADRLPSWLRASPATRRWQRAHALSEACTGDSPPPLALVERRRLGFWTDALVLYAD